MVQPINTNDSAAPNADDGSGPRVNEKAKRDSDAPPSSRVSVADTSRASAAAADLLSVHERRIAIALAEASMPTSTSSSSSSSLPGGGAETVVRYERLLAMLGEDVARAARAGLWAAEAWPVSRFGRPLTMLSREGREAAIVRWSESSSRYERWLLRAILTPLKSAHFDDPRLFAHVGCRHGAEPPVVLESARWMEQVIDGRNVEADLDLQCEVVVIGTGAGGAAAAYELAKRGRAVLLLEGGHFPTRAEFRGRSSEAYKKLYLGLGSTVALGNVGAPILAGRGVGGSTTINSGTCYRAPEHTLERWGERYGLTMLSSDRLAPYYERVESMLGVAEAAREHLGGTARVVARGAELLQLSHKPLRRNAPGCDGQGVCCFGCPTGAKRSTDVSYVPEALKRGAQLVTGARVEKVLAPGGHARGVVARLASGRRLTVRAEAVIVAGGALLTPLLLARSNLCTRSGWLGKNLSIHPATKVMALFDEVIDMSRGIPQSYAIDSYVREGIMFEGASTPLDVTAVAIPWVGHRFMDVIARYPNIATFGLMIQDTSRGEVHSGPSGSPLIRYSMNKHDLARMQRGVEILCNVFLRAGATRVMPMIPGCEEIVDDDGVAKLRKMRLRGGDFDVSAFHPLGTCRMGTDPMRSCVGPDGEAHDVSGLYVADGSTIPSSLGANPQMTIMALALRTAEVLDARLDAMSASHARAHPSDAPTTAALDGRDESVGRHESGGHDDDDDALEADPKLTFGETMSGTFRTRKANASGSESASESELAPESKPSGQQAPEPYSPELRPFSFSLRARSRGLLDFARTREVAITGELMAEGFGARCPLTGTLGLDVLMTQRLPYDFRFTADDGRVYRFVGEKRVKLGALHRSMTVLPGEITDDGGRVVGTAEVAFDIERDLWDFLGSFRITAAGTALKRLRRLILSR